VRGPRQRRAFSTVGGAVDVAGDPGEAQALAKLWDVDRGLERALTHGFHSYAGRMHPSIARGAIQRWSGAGDRVVDPFCGSGTVLVEAMGLGRAAMGTDASPLAVAIAAARTSLLGEAGRQALVAEAARIAEEVGERSRRRRRPELPPWARRELERFHPHVLFELADLRALVLALPRTEVSHAVRMCFSSILVKLMKAGPEAPRDGAEKRIARGFPSRLLADRAAELAGGLAALERRAPAGTLAPLVELGDARALSPSFATASARLVLASPPYAGTYDYAAQHDVRFAWLELPRRPFERAQIGARGAGLGVDPVAWRESQRRWLAEIGRLLAPGGAALLAVGDGVVGNRPEDTPAAIAAAAASAGLVPVARASQVRPTHDRRLQALFAREPRREHLLLLKRT
jgi:SAM-dependent methyltransferase